MDEDLHDIDNLFKKALEEHTETPSQKVWENLDKNLEKKKVISITKSYRKLKWVAAALLIFSIGMAAYTYNLKLRYKEVVKRNKINNYSPVGSTNKPAISIMPEVSKDTEEVFAEAKKQSSKVSSNNSISDWASQSLKARKDNIFNENIASSKNLKTATNSSINKTPSAITGNNSKGGNKEVLVLKSTNRHTAAKSSDQKIKTTSFENWSSALNTKQGKVTKSNELNEAVPNYNDKGFKVETTPGLKLQLDTTRLSDIATVSNQAKALPTDASPLTLNSHLTPIVMPSYQAQNFVGVGAKKTTASNSTNFIASVFFSADAAFTHLANDHPHFREDEKHEIKNTEKNRFSSTAGVLVEKNISRNFSLQTGLSLSTRITDIYAKTLFARPDDRGNLNYRLSCSLGYTFVSVKSSAAPVAGDSVKSNSSTSALQYVAIPFGIKYHFTVGKFSFNPAIAIAENFRTKGSIETVVSTASGNEKSTNQDIQGLKSGYMDAAFRMDLAYNINRRISVSLTPGARLALTSITNHSPVKTYLNSIGLGASLNIHF